MPEVFPDGPVGDRELPCPAVHPGSQRVIGHDVDQMVPNRCAQGRCNVIDAIPGVIPRDRFLVIGRRVMSRPQQRFEVTVGHLIDGVGYLVPAWGAILAPESDVQGSKPPEVAVFGL